MAQLTTEAMQKLKTLYRQCEGEEALEEYIICMMRMLNGLAQIQDTAFHDYEKRILEYPMEVFTAEFMEQVNLALVSNNVSEKKKYIDDIENSLFEVINVYKNILDSTTNSDRQMFMSKAVDTKMYELSPKICAFYSEIMEEIVNMFGARDEKLYAFFLQPTMRSRIHAKHMFSMRNKSGKVVIVYVPENAVEEFDVLPIHLLHEAFHIITKGERLRKERAENYLKNMVFGVRELLFESVVFREEETDYDVKEKLMEYWFADVRTLKKEIKLKEEDSRELYSHALTKTVVAGLQKLLHQMLDKISEGVDTCFCFNDSKSFSEYMQLRKMSEDSTNQITNNAINILSGKYLTHISDLYMRLYREAYADLACLLTLEADPEIYKDTFQRAVQFRVNNQDSDFEKDLRCMFVADAMAENMTDACSRRWEEYTKELKKKISCPQNNTGQLGESRVKIALSSPMEELFLQYFRGCAREIKEKLLTISELPQFRNKMSGLMQSNQEDILPLVLGSAAYQRGNR